MRTLGNGNALIHGAYLRDVILPRRRFPCPVGGLRADFGVTGTLEERYLLRNRPDPVEKAAPDSRPARVRSRAAGVLQPKTTTDAKPKDPENQQGAEVTKSASQDRREQGSVRTAPASSVTPGRQRSRPLPAPRRPGPQRRNDIVIFGVSA
jgi:hypothetical protein